MAKHGIEAPNREKYAAKGGIERERLKALVEAGMSIAEIAEAVGLSKTAVRHWLGRLDLRTNPKRASDARREARDAGLLRHTFRCPRHGDVEFVLEGRGYYRCKRCRSEQVSARRRLVKALLVKEAGGCCAICGYNRHVGALEFHHVDPSQKRMSVSKDGVTLVAQSSSRGGKEVRAPVLQLPR
jgi:DNA-binding transcriptional ArsR family regulator